MRYLAIDFGFKRTGLALCDKSEQFSSPLMVIDKPGDVIPKIKQVIKNEDVEAVVVGLPFNMDGTEGPQAKATRTFAASLAKEITIPVEMFDERLSSFEAEEKLLPGDFTRKQTKKRLDAVAAANILAAFLEHKKDQGSGLPAEGLE